MSLTKPSRLIWLAATALLLGAAAARADHLRPSSDVLVPYFELDFENLNRVSLFAVCNGADEPVDVVVTVFTNWGIPVLTVPRTIGPDAVLTVNLRDWLLYGNLGDRTLPAAELAHIQAALAGEPSPKDGLYYSTRVMPGRGVGYVTIRTVAGQHHDSLWGDYFIVDPAEDFAEGETLVNIDHTVECDRACERRGVRFLSGGGFDAGTEFMLWTSRRGFPSSNPEFPAGNRVRVEIKVYNEQGTVIDELELFLLPNELIKVDDLELLEPFGWFDILIDEEDAFFTAHYSEEDRYSVAIHAYCLPEEAQHPGLGPDIEIHKLVNGIEATHPPGPTIPAGSPVNWSFVVTNTGDLPLADVTVTDDLAAGITCPKGSLDVGESMTCTAAGIAQICQVRNTAVAAGVPPEGPPQVQDRASAFYFGDVASAIDLEKLTNGEDADTTPGPALRVGDPVNWTYQVTNTGATRLTDVAVTDDQGVAVSCPKTVLDPGESMTCTGSGVAVPGQYTNLGTATGRPPCGPEVKDEDVSHYWSSLPQITIEKLTNGYDADDPTGLRLQAGEPVVWTYLVTNTGDVKLSQITVVDDHEVAVTCPKTALMPSESMVCTASGIAVAGWYTNLGTATGKPDLGGPVSDDDPSGYFGESPGIDLEKLVNGQDADTPPGPTIPAGNAVQWAYVITNTGDVALTAVTVTDDSGVAVTCPKTALEPGESMTCTAGGTAVADQYHNLATATGMPPHGPAVTDVDPAYYFGQAAQIGVEKLIDGNDADTPPGPTYAVGATVLWTYVVTNLGNVTLIGIAVTDDKGVAVTCPKTTLAPAESMTCTSSDLAVAGQYSNVGTATGTPPVGPAVVDTDPCHYFGQEAVIDLEKFTNGQDADLPAGPEIPVGAAVTWTYVVTNKGNVTLTNVAVTDDKGVTVTCPKTALAVDESMTCSASGTAVAGQYSNVGTATGTPPSGPAVTDTDPSHYFGKTPGNQGCTPGYWKNHTGSWPPTGYSTGQAVDSVFPNVNTYYPALGNATLLQALGFGGGPGNEGAAEILLRAGVAAVLNASHPDVDYPRTAAAVLTDVNAALLQNRDAMLALAAALDADNNRGCPLH